MHQKSTDELLKIIAQENNLRNYFQEYSDQFENTTLTEALEELTRVHNRTKSDIIGRSGLDRVYAYQIFNGTKNPGRDKLLALCIAAGATLKETQRILRLGGANELHPRNIRDSVIIHSIDHGKSVDELNELLYDLNIAILT